MRVINPYVEVPSIDGTRMLRNIEEFGRTCYRSEGGVGDNSYLGFVKRLLDRGHESVLEHEKMTVRIICDRGVSHEIVRHRIAAYRRASRR